jgi:hypothetical protein
VQLFAITTSLTDIAENMPSFSSLTSALALASAVNAQCGSGSPEVVVDGEGTAFTAVRGSEELYSGSNYLEAINAGLASVASGERITVLASGAIGASTISLSSGQTFEGCGTIDVGFNSGRGAIRAIDQTGVSIPYLTMTGSPYFGLQFSGVSDLTLGRITMDLTDGLGIRFDRDGAPNANVVMDSITVTGAGSHAVETWNIDGLTINEVIAQDVGECGLLIQNTRDAQVGLVDGTNVAAGVGYATLRFANQNGRYPDGTYPENIKVDRVVSRGGGRGIFCVSESGGAVIGDIDLQDNGNNAILIENCYNVAILGGTVTGGGEVRISARTEFANTRDISLSIEVNGNTVRESPCGENMTFAITGDAALDIC